MLLQQLPYERYQEILKDEAMMVRIKETYDMFKDYMKQPMNNKIPSVAFGVPTITDDKAGFGQWVESNFTLGINSCGVQVVSRTDSNYIQDRDEISSAALAYETEGTAGRSEARHAAFLTSAKADWRFFIKHYDKAFEVALANAAKRMNN